MKPSGSAVGTLLRAAVFCLIYAGFAIIWSLVCLVIGPFLPFEKRIALVNVWTRLIFWTLRHVNGVEIEVRGLDGAAVDRPLVIAANHQSNLETFYLQLLFSPQATILKRELLWIPFFGWGLKMLRPIAINRKRASTALREIVRQGGERLKQGMHVTIYPEGTRRPPGEPGAFHSGAAMLARHAGVPILPVAHNAGNCWPARSMLPRPGRVIFEIGTPIEPGEFSTKELNAKVEQWVTHKALELAAMNSDQRPVVGGQ